VIAEMGKAMMGTGEAEGEDRALKAADLAISNPLLDDVSMKGARGVLINITGGPDLTLFEVEQAANRVRAEVDPDANIIFGNTILEDMEGRIRVSVVATGIDAAKMQMPQNVEPIRPYIKPVPRMQEPKPDVRHAMVSQMQAANPVRLQVEALADGLGATTEHADAEAKILGTEGSRRVIGDDDIPPMPGELVRPASVQPLRAAPAPAPEPEQPEERRGWGFLGRRKPKETAHHEPAAAPRPIQAAQPRATAQPIARPGASAEYPRQGAPATQGQPDDLFPEPRRDEQFEIPAFLRRQTN